MEARRVAVDLIANSAVDGLARDSSFGASSLELRECRHGIWIRPTVSA